MGNGSLSNTILSIEKDVVRVFTLVHRQKSVECFFLVATGDFFGSRRDVEYELEQFPGLVYQPDEPAVVVLLFGSAKTVITGGKVPEDAEAATEVLISKLTNLSLLR